MMKSKGRGVGLTRLGVDETGGGTGLVGMEMKLL